jgi:hypothetical protein
MRGRLGRAAHGGGPVVPAASYRTPRAYDLLDAPAAAGHRVLLQWERLGFPLGPVLAASEAAPSGRLQFFVAAGTAASLAADLADLGWTPEELDLRAVSGSVTAEAVLPPADSPRWVRAPEAGRPGTYPPAQMLLGSLAYACRRRLVGRIGGGSAR